MLVQLAIRDIVLIDRLVLDFAPGLSVLTGETGAGKSILLDAFALALGARGDGSLVRHGEAQGQVTAVFSLPSDHPARALLAENDIPDEGDLILRRVQFADGRTRALVNDQAVSVQVLRRIGETLVEIHGQHDDRAMTDPAAHRSLLDAFAGAEEAAADVADRHAALKAAREELDALRARIEAAAKEADFLRHAVGELDKLAVEAGEEETLAARRQAMLNAQKVVAEIHEAHEVVAGGASPLTALAAALRRLERRAAQAPELIEPSVAALSAAIDALDIAGSALDEALRAAEFDPHELERIEERLFAIRAAARKYDVAADDLPAVAARFADDLAAIDAGEARLGALERAVADKEALFVSAARALSERRQGAAARLAEEVQSELPPLKLERARFIVDVISDPDLRGPDGFDRVEFHVQTNPGTKPGPMMKVASGGELSRFMLALKVRLADRGSAPTLVFDEIDTGVGGAVADAIGGRLARLAARVQVLSVTHAPQVAAKAGRHYLIAKEAADPERVATRVAALESERRREEIARMLSGAVITEEARAAADRLLSGAS
jgi:DNA repair protein RecN (Recombination protein N)